MRLDNQAESDHEVDEESDVEDSEGVELNGSDSVYIEAEDGPGISDGRTIRRPSSRSADSNLALSQYLNQVREELVALERINNVSDDSDDSEEVAQAMQGGASPQLVAPGLLAGAEDNDSNINTSQQSVTLTPPSLPNLVLSLSPVVHAPLTEQDFILQLNTELNTELSMELYLEQ